MNTGKKELDLDVVKAGLFGFATADALGVPVEFTLREMRSAKPLKEMVGYGTHDVPEGTWSDDTSMTIAGMDSIGMCNGSLDFDDIMRKYCAWFSKAYYTATDKLFDIGIGTSRALESYASNLTDAISSGGTSDNNNGNGSLMRMLPMVYYLYSKDFDEAREADLINKFSAMTHGHEASKLGCKIYYDFMKELLNGKSKEEAYEHLQSIDYNKFYGSDSISRYRRILDGNLKNVDSKDISSSGYVVSTLEASIWTVLRTDNYEDAVVTAVNLGDDTDTVGAVTGSMVGTIYGVESIPERWISKLKKKEFLNDICSRFTKSINLKPERISERFYDDYALAGKYDNQGSGLVQMLDDSKSSENDFNADKNKNL